MVTSPHALAHDATLAYLDTLGSGTIALRTIEVELLEKLTKEIRVENAGRLANERITIPKMLTGEQVCQIMLARYTVVSINLVLLPNGDPDYSSSPDEDLLGLYMAEGPMAGTYVTDDMELQKLAWELNPSLTKTESETLFKKLRGRARRVPLCTVKHLVAVNNGVFNFETKELLDFSPEMVFTTKSRVNYVNQPLNPTVIMPDGVAWDVVSWVNDLSDDPEVQVLLWELLSAVVRPQVSWGRAAFFYSERGNNGKGTLCHLMRNLIGAGSHTSIPIADFGKDFMLEPLVRATAVIVDENDVGVFIDKAANFKAAVTGDKIALNRKFKTPITMTFRGMIVQCLNAFMATKDKSDSFARRQLFVPFVKDFRGIERKYIKDDYLSRTDVLEYVLWRVLNMSHTQLSTPAACEALLEEYREHNDPVRDFWNEMKDQFSWDLVPFSFLYDLFLAWMKASNPGGKPVQRKRFTSDVVRLVNEQNGDWFCEDVRKLSRPAGRMNAPEHLIMEFNLENWMNPVYTGSDWDRRARPSLKANYRGIERA